jgi:DNA-binding Xre family transcriptional regulator
MIMVNYNKLLEKLKEKGISTYTIRQKALIPQGTLGKIKMCSGDSMEEIEIKLKEYKEKHGGKEFMCDVSTKTIEDICQLLQCQPEELIEWKVDLKPELAYENRYGTTTS